MKNVVVRSLSGAVYIAVIIAAIIGGFWWTLLLALAFGILATWEFEKLAIFREHRTSLSWSCLFVDLITVITLIVMPWLESGMGMFWSCTILMLMVCFVVRLSLAIFDQGDTPFRNVAKSAMAILYASLPMMAMVHIYVFDKWLLMVTFVMIWLNDTGAFCVGSLLGKHRLCERLSPKKSWEGFWGGMAFCVACGAVCYFAIGMHQLTLWAWLAMGVIVSIFATIGDLFESMFKRTIGVKDSGNIIPGHGGILDRIDSLLLVAPAVYAMLLIFLVYGFGFGDGIHLI